MLTPNHVVRRGRPTPRGFDLPRTRGPVPRSPSIRSRCLAATGLSLLSASACNLAVSGEAADLSVGVDAGPSTVATGSAGATGGGPAPAPVLDAGVAPEDDAAPEAAAFPSNDSGSAVDASAVADEGGLDAGPPVSLPAPIGAWGFDEGTGTESADLSGNGHPAILVGGATWGAGRDGPGLVLDGETGYADVGVTLVDTTMSFSVVSWVEFATVDTWATAVSEDDVNGSLFALKLRGDGTNTFDFDVETSDIMSPGFLVAQSTSTAQVSVWVQLAGVYDASADLLHVYVNGVPAATTAVDQQLLAASGDFVIGRGLYNGVSGSFLQGTLDDVAVYDCALTDAQVAAVYTVKR
jgi:Concanavalin A-like lectin/glucanases superfamily